MSACPQCGFANISGVDECEQCGQPLDDQYLSEPASEVERSLLQDRVGILEPRPAITLPPSATVDEALKLLAKHQIGCILITEEGKLLGIFSERDALFRIGADVDRLRTCPVSEFMTPKVQTLDPQAKIAYAVHMMDLGHYRHVPIVREDGVVVGIISVRDILRYLTERMGLTAA
ncbi:MAG TPA: CBS domain-containing protein [Pirellulaceae bacterium]